MKPKWKKSKDGFNKTPEYRKLVDDLRGIIDEARARGIDIGGRDDILMCRQCGTYEDITCKGEWEVRKKDGRLTDHERFIILGSKEGTYRRNKIRYFKITYSFICPACGLQQEQIIRDQ